MRSHLGGLGAFSPLRSSGALDAVGGDDADDGSAKLEAHTPLSHAVRRGGCVLVCTTQHRRG